jgi:hypothetical protein
MSRLRTFLEATADMQIERRKLKRFVVKEQTFVAFRPEFTKIGRIRDISRSGLGCEYLVYKDSGADVNEEPLSSEIDLIVTGNTFYASRIPCTVVYDIEMVKNEATFAGMTENRRCGLELGELTEEQKKQIEVLIRNYAVKGKQSVVSGR